MLKFARALRFRSINRVNKPLKQVLVEYLPTEEAPREIEAAITEERNGFALLLPSLRKEGRLSMSWTDQDGLAAAMPHETLISITPDDPPSVELRRAGIGKIVTPRARIPFELSARDDHQLKRTGLRVNINDQEPFDLPLRETTSNRMVEPCEVDLLTLPSLLGNTSETIEPGDRITVQALAADYYDLAPRKLSLSEPIEFEVVTAEEVLIRHGAREQELRTRLEAALSDARRLAYTLERLSRSADQASLSSSRLDARKLRTELSGIAEGFSNARDAVVNNRLDQPALVERLEEGIISPLIACDKQEFRLLLANLRESGNNDITVARGSLDRVIEVVTRVMSQIESSETYNKVVAELRELIREQRRLNRVTDLERSEQARRLLLGPSE